jgi:hypothetical protein
MHTEALAWGLGERLNLIPQMANPKNLFGTLLDSPLQAVPLHRQPRLVATA